MASGGSETDSSGSSKGDSDGSVYEDTVTKLGGGVSLAADERLAKNMQKLTLQQSTKRLEKLKVLKTAYVKIQIRTRLTMDGGKSQMAG